MDTRALARKNLDARLLPLRNQALSVPAKGWVRAIRDALGMTTAQLASRLGVTQPRITVLEKAEVSGTVTLKTLRDTAEALDCVLVYAMVPRTSLDDALRQQVEQKVALVLTEVEHTMRLESQAVRAVDLDHQRKQMVDQVLSGNLKGVWDK